jgi:hypothetical protein
MDWLWIALLIILGLGGLLFVGAVLTLFIGAVIVATRGDINDGQ